MIECKILKTSADIFLILVIIAFILGITYGSSESYTYFIIGLIGSIIVWANLKIIPIMCEKTIEIAKNTKQQPITNNSSKKVTKTTTKKPTKQPIKDTPKKTTTKKTTKK